MGRRTFLSATLVLMVFVAWAPVVGALTPLVPTSTVSSSSEIDGFSFRFPSDSTLPTYSYFKDGHWSPWYQTDDDGDSGPGEESELVLVPYGVTQIRMRGITSASAIHPITVSKDPVRVRVASTKSVGVPSVLSRAEWGADNSYLFGGLKTEDVSAGGDVAKGDSGVVSSSQSDNKVNDCLAAQQNYPSEFKVDSTVRRDKSGRKYSWPLQYSSDVRLLVVHHSALLVQGDPRPAVERVRALYKYHALNKGWGDIGYHFVVDENGQVYEGRQGGKGVVGGHAYCNNTGTIGIVVLGNFELEEPSQAQVRGLQSLLASLARDYGIDVHRSVQFHGKVFSSPIVGHRDVLSTLCPGFALYGGLKQIVSHVQSGALDSSVIFPQLPRSSSSSPSATADSSRMSSGIAEGVSFVGRTAITINPGGKQRLSFTYTAPLSGAYEGKKIGDVRLSTPAIKLWLDDGLHQIPITKGILLESDLPAGESASMQMIIQAPMDAGSYAFDIAGLHFTLAVSGRRARTGEFINPFGGNPAMIVRPAAVKQSAELRTVVRPSLRSPQSPPSSSAASTSVASSVVEKREPRVSTTPFQTSPLIRIRLSASASPTVTFTDAGILNNQSVNPGTAVTLLAQGAECEALKNGSLLLKDAVIRLQSISSNTLTIDAVRSKIGLYRGTIECRVIDGALALINELSLEDSMAGLAEEPDAEPYQKQRAFAIAARTYAAYYMQPSNRKFPGMPYDGSDDPAVFQSYAGMNFAANNPQWLRAVNSTAKEVLRMNGQLIKPPYFSNDDGRTRSPSEAGWTNFPFAGIFLSKPDPWCRGMALSGHGVGMSGCGAKGQALEGRSAEQILQYYYPGVRITE